jgi:hypothetical protein
MENDIHEYTSVPEMPWPMLIAATALTLDCVALRRKSGHPTSSKVAE